MSFLKKLFALDRGLLFILAASTLTVLLFSCKTQSNEEHAGEVNSDLAFAKAETKNDASSEKNVQQRNISQEWKDYWYAGKAEITSYKLEQARYGEMREGTAALIFVTEDFLPEVQVKADNPSKSNIPVIKLNTTKNFATGIYPYSLMTSAFYPVQEEAHAVKISHSMQEWCGQMYVQLNNRDSFEVMSHSYFEGRADQDFTLPKAILENELWTQLRINPKELPIGTLQIIPDFGYTMMKHKELKAYPAEATLIKNAYHLTYNSLNRTFIIYFSENFPHTIEGWEETYPDTRTGEKLTTKAIKIKTIKSAYWGKNSNVDAVLRTELGLN